MRVMCIANDVDRLNDAAVRKRLAETIRLEGGDNDLVVGDTYDICAIEWWSDGGIRVFIHTVKISDYPYPLEMFNVIDHALPANWCVSVEKRHYGMIIKRISFPEWADDDLFYENLIEGYEEVIAIYKQRCSV